jgi:transportin-3
MATNGAQQVYEPVLAAHNLMQSASNRTQKEQAHEFLEKFQKSQEAWTTTLAMLESSSVDAAAKLFAATTLKGKVCSPSM